MFSSMVSMENDIITDDSSDEEVYESQNQNFSWNNSIPSNRISNANRERKEPHPIKQHTTFASPKQNQRVEELFNGPNTEHHMNKLNDSNFSPLIDEPLSGKTVPAHSLDILLHKNNITASERINSSRPTFCNSSFFDDTHDFQVPEIPSSESHTEKNQRILRQLSDIFQISGNSNLGGITFHKSEISDTIKKYCNILTDAHIEFTTDLPVHLYSVYLLSTRNKNLPDPNFTLWPLPSNELITPRHFLQTTKSNTLGKNANDVSNELRQTRFTKINFQLNNNRPSNPTKNMLEFWNPQIDSIEELKECMDAIFEKKINSQINAYSKSHSLDKNGLPKNYVYQRHTPDDITLDALLKRKIIDKLDKVIDKLVATHMVTKKGPGRLKKKLTSIDGTSNLHVPNYGMDWLSVLSMLPPNDKKSRLLLLMIFNLKLDKDHVNGPVDSYPDDFEMFAKAKTHRDKVLKILASKHISPSKKSKNIYRKAKRCKTGIRHQLDSFLGLKIRNIKENRRNEKLLASTENRNNSENEN